LLIDRQNWHLHRGWVGVTLVAFLLASAWYFASAWRSSTWPGGSSLPGLTLGVLGGLIILFEFLLWGRKKLRVWRIGRAQTWLRAHIWLGLLCVPLLIYHSGFRFGGALSTVLMILLLIVVVSGIVGLALQQVLPTRMLEAVPAETIYSQIDYVLTQLADEGERLVESVCGPAPGEPVDALPGHEPAAAGTAPLVVGAVRSVGKVQGKVLETRAAPAAVPDSDPLRTFFTNRVRPYLLHGAAGSSPLASPNRSEVLFAELRVRLDPAAHATVATLEALCTQRRQLDLQARLHAWLHGWLWVHLPLSVALVVIMFVHIWVALKYM
jgi:hypothetical protein